MKAYLQLQQWWEETGTGIRTETTLGLFIAGLENRYNLSLPEDFRDYLRFSSPVAEASDARMGTWWEFKRIKNIPDNVRLSARRRFP